MPESANEGWQELQVPSRRQCPKLFYSFTAQDESITLLLTDLISIWESTLDRYDILSDAARQHASIDPSVSADQFEVLLSKIGKSLKDGENFLSKQELRNSQLLLLTTKIDLPKPLRPLEWTFKLVPQDGSELAERILRPSLHEVAVSQEKVKTLLRAIKDKDHIISRLLERIGSSSIDLGLVFPGITGMARRGGQVSVADAKKHVPGMAAFDEKSWVKQFANDEGYEGADRTGLGNLVRGCEKCFAHTKSEHADWIKELSSPTKRTKAIDMKNEEPRSTKREIRGEVEHQNDPTDSDNDFERQPTPPGLKSKGHGKSEPSPSPKGEDDDDEPPAKGTKASKIGGLGRRSATKSFGSTKSPPRPSIPPRRRSDASTSTATASEDEEDDIRPAVRASSRERSLNPKLGSLRKKQQPARTSPAPNPSSKAPSPPTKAANKDQVRSTSKSSDEDEASDLDLDIGDHSPPPAATPSRHHRLGQIGRKSATPAATPSKARGDSSPPRKDRGNDSASPSQATTPRRKLGRLGARKQRDTQTHSSSAEPEPSPHSSSKAKKTRSKANDNDSDTSSSSPSPSGRKLASRPSTKNEPTQPNPEAPAPAPAPEEPEKEETAEEIANRRRLELKRTIAANAGAKKKRRF
ncbi:hypothetical protein LTR47_008490 [Exophiala xenobiotica]|nr:hypothetical protein LTR47_008490 [Exophiala xenobiotica]KAK5246480.1 hypothetical protein LTS06_008214 [Exophiala xenobiotica]KAK5261044.1 hypothetical protein LTR40_002973 [Exophiala xenobiotica]KAK5347179.1 hypothetical protein LTR61_009060 [Exophiala xenobiotica]KAK5362215.1 hypothetical protein LTR11_009607 [Exophiala xenobiotica]